MTKMVIGRGCCDKYDITADDITEAKRRMREDFAFIGLQERWNTSVEMFHLQHGGKLFYEELEIRRAADRPVMKRSMQVLFYIFKLYLYVYINVVLIFLSFSRSQESG